MYYLLNGNNGSTYIVNASGYNNIKLSLKFYRTRNLKQALIKLTIIVYLFFLYKLYYLISFKAFKSKEQIDLYLSNLGLTKKTHIDDNCSVLISSTRDKVIVHHHGNYFHKFAFGDSYHNVKREANIYQILDRNLSNFSISSFYDFSDDGVSSCSFKMAPPNNKKVKSIGNAALCSPLAEFFSVVTGNYISTSEYFSMLRTTLKGVKFHENSDDVLNDILDRLENLPNQSLPLGLVHGDFKPWNLLYTKPLTIFDFEEAKTNGLPLEDYLNFIVDPIVRYQSAEYVASLILSESTIYRYKEYLDSINCSISYILLVYLYLLGRIIFWSEKEQLDTALSYYDLLNFVDNSEFKLDD